MNRLLIIACVAFAGFATLASAQSVTTPSVPSVPIEIAVPEVTPVIPEPNTVETSTEQGRTQLYESFEPDRRLRRLEAREHAIEDTQFKFNFRTMYFDREKFDGSASEALATGGWVGTKTGYFMEHFSFGVTGYTSQKVDGDASEDGTLMLEPVQAGYSVLGEAYADILIFEGLNLYVGRKEFDTPFINRNDTRMTPNTFEAIVLQGVADVGSDGATLKYGIGYFDQIKERNSDDFVSMAVDAGAAVERGVVTAGALYTKDAFSIGAIDYHSADIINIFYAESKLELPIQLPFADNAIPRIATQVVDQRSTGDQLLTGGEFNAQQFGFKGELPVGDALFTAGYTIAGGEDNNQSPWSGYPGYTSVQVEDFNRAGEGAMILRAAYDLPWVDGLSAYALYVNGSTPDDPAQFRKNELDLNLQWTPSEAYLKGLSLRLRYALVEEHGPTTRDLSDFRVICNYALEF
jgi:hypothetical protein